MSQKIEEFGNEELQNWLKSFDVVLCDCDGVLWHINKLIPDAEKTVNLLIELGKTVYLVTNNAINTREEFAQKAEDMGINVGKENIITASMAVAAYLKSKNFNKTAYVLGTTGLAEDLEHFGIKTAGSGTDVLSNGLFNFIAKEFKPDPEIGAVVVAVDQHLSFPKLIRAATYLKNEETHFLCTSDEDKYVVNGIVVPLSGVTMAAMEKVSGRKAVVVGKPEKWMWDLLLKEKIKSKRILMVGDSLKTDILFGKQHGFHTLLVGTGTDSIDNPRNEVAPDFYADSLGKLYEKLSSK